MLQLHAEYPSDVAPNRKLLYQQAKDTFKTQGANPKCRGSGGTTLLNFLEAADGKISNLAHREFALAGGDTMEKIPDWQSYPIIWRISLYLMQRHK